MNRLCLRIPKYVVEHSLKQHDKYPSTHQAIVKGEDELSCPGRVVVYTDTHLLTIIIEGIADRVLQVDGRKIECDVTSKLSMETTSSHDVPVHQMSELGQEHNKEKSVARQQKFMDGSKSRFKQRCQKMKRKLDIPSGESQSKLKEASNASEEEVTCLSSLNNRDADPGVELNPKEFTSLKYDLRDIKTKRPKRSSQMENSLGSILAVNREIHHPPGGSLFSHISTDFVKETGDSVCLICFHDFLSKSELLTHLNSSHKFNATDYWTFENDHKALSSGNCDPKLVQKYMETMCGLCGKTFTSKQVRGFKNHINKVHFISFDSYKEALCLTRNDRQEFLQQMQKKQHNSIPKYSCPADNCTGVYAHIGNLQYHVKMKHNNDNLVSESLEKLVYEAYKKKAPTNIPCIVCGQLRGGTAIAKHMQSVHSHMPNFKELLALMKAKYKEELKMKRRLYERDYQRQAGQCKYCDRSFTSKYPLARHRLVCTGNPNRKKYLRCKLCDYGAWHQETLDSHIKKRHIRAAASDQTFTCEVCGVSYSRLSSLTSHMKTKHQVCVKGPVKPHVCPQCGKEFYYQGPFRDHLATHSDERNHVCAQCGKAFKTKRDLGDHTKHVHQDKYKFHCPQCGHGVQQRRYLLKHVCGRVKRRQQKTASVSQVATNVQQSDQRECQNQVESQDSWTCSRENVGL